MADKRSPPIGSSSRDCATSTPFSSGPDGLRDLTQARLRETGTQPEVFGDRCVHALLGTASCRACVDACPPGAWVFDDEQLGIDAALCDGCNLCVPACPEGAIQPCEPPVPVLTDHGTHALFACEAGSTGAADGVIPCLHALGLADILSLHGTGVRDITVHTADCDNCTRGTTVRFGDRLGEANRMLAARCLPTIESRETGAAAWAALAAGADPQAAGPSLNRRQFFRHTVAAVAEGHDRYALGRPGREPRFATPGMIMPGRQDTALLPHVPRITASACSACDTCVKLCPHEALSLDRDVHTGELAYRITAYRCSGCHICVDVCEHDAIAVQAWAGAASPEVPLASLRCRACGNPYHVIRDGSGDRPLCGICTTKNHNRLLFQRL